MSINLEITGALSGLAGAVSNNGRTESSDSVVHDALMLCDENPDSERTADMIKRIQAEKFSISPSCAACMNPCGNTSDYTSQEFMSEPDDVQQEKIRMITSAIEYLKSGKPMSNYVYKALIWWKYTFEAEKYDEITSNLTC